jgi:hypothetical protein
VSAPRKPKPKPTPSTFPCPHCGADVPAGRPSCRECGSDASTGWKSSEEIDYTSLDLPDGYRADDARSDELPPTRTPRWVVVTALVTALAMIAGVTGVLALL